MSATPAAARPRDADRGPVGQVVLLPRVRPLRRADGARGPRDGLHLAGAGPHRRGPPRPARGGGPGGGRPPQRRVDRAGAGRRPPARRPAAVPRQRRRRRITIDESDLPASVAAELHVVRAGHTRPVIETTGWVRVPMTLEGRHGRQPGRRAPRPRSTPSRATCRCCGSSPTRRRCRCTPRSSTRPALALHRRAQRLYDEATAQAHDLADRTAELRARRGRGCCSPASASSSTPSGTGSPASCTTASPSTSSRPAWPSRSPAATPSTSVGPAPGSATG